MGSEIKPRQIGLGAGTGQTGGGAQLKSEVGCAGLVIPATGTSFGGTT
jgi:hypothetical protein